MADLCGELHVIYFPPTIADIRYGLSLQQQKQVNAVATAAKQALPRDHLSLDLGADDGSEFPDSHQSSLTGASLQLALDRAMDDVKSLNPSLVIVVATDVRDRLFLFDQLRLRLPAATLLDLETDNLLTHPDFLYASRGALGLSSGNLNTQSLPGLGVYGCERPPPPPVPVQNQFWATDIHGLLSDAAGRLRDADQDPGDPPCAFPGKDRPERSATRRDAIVNVVTFNGFRAVSKSYAPDSGGAPDLVGFGNLHVLEVYAPVMCLLLPLIWLPAIAKKSAATLPDGLNWLRRHGFCATVVLTVPILVLAALINHGLGPQAQSAYQIGLWVMFIFGSFGLWRCSERLADDLGQAPEASAGAGPALREQWRGFAVAAFAIALEPGLRTWMDRRALVPVDESLLLALGSDLASGLAFYGVIALEAFVMLRGSAARTDRCALRKHPCWRARHKPGRLPGHTRARLAWTPGRHS